MGFQAEGRQGGEDDFPQFSRAAGDTPPAGPSLWARRVVQSRRHENPGDTPPCRPEACNTIRPCGGGVRSVGSYFVNVV